MVGCGGIKTGRYVHIVLATKHAPLNLCEVQVMGEVAGDVCENAPLKSDASHVSLRIDGASVFSMTKLLHDTAHDKELRKKRVKGNSALGMLAGCKRSWTN